MLRTVSKIKYSTASAFVLVLSALTPMLGGCSGKVGLSFSVDEINIKVGEERDCLPYAVFDPITAADKSFALVTSDSGIAEVDGTIVRGVGKGAATVTAADGAEIKVNVSYRAPQELFIRADGATVITIDDISDAEEITFTATLDGNADPDTEIVWETDGENCGRGATFAFKPARYGEYRVCARADGLSADASVRIYRPSEAHAEFDGELVQVKDLSPVTFYARERKDSRDAPSTVEWRVNGEPYSSSHIFEFTPSVSGEYKIELRVNGVPRTFSDGSAYATVSATGGRAPRGNVRLDADGVYIVWRDGGGATAVSITEPNGKRTVYERIDGEHSYRFGGGVFDATGLIEPCAAEPKSYTVAVIADGRGDDFEFMQYGADAEPFVENKLFISNMFLDEAHRAAELIREAYACGRQAFRVYLGRGVTVSDAESAFLSAAGEFGLSANVGFDGRIASVELSAFDNAPSGGSEQTESPQMYAELPHIEYDGAKLRGESYVLSAERLPRAVEVDNTEKLLLAVMRGYKPEPVGAARTAYARARNALINIIGRDYDDRRKVHAIYDWLQFASFRTVGDSGAPCNYIDGMFGVTGGGSVRSGMSDKGLAKTFALMCGMEGIECSIAVGADGKHFNTVTLDGAHYTVDVFGGERGGAELGLADAHAELTSHGGLLTTDGASAYAVPKTPYLNKTVYSGAYVDAYIDIAEHADNASTAAAVSAIFSSQTLGKVSVYMPMGISIFQNTTLGAELALDTSLTEAQAETVRKAAVKAAAEYVKATYGGEPSNIRSYRAQDKLFIIVPVPTAALPHAAQKGV
ncbi:MAG: hypothetical protein HFJ21_05340 [Clostridia bacterium]|nr:hypothetical protein [Clostridia bacterium]MCI9459866.1 hypothetical protein [Clostridia bacterium]